MPFSKGGPQIPCVPTAEPASPIDSKETEVQFQDCDRTVS